MPPAPSSPTTLSGRSRSDREPPSPAIPRRPRVSWWLGLVLALGFAAVVTPAITAEHWLLGFDAGSITEGQNAPFTVRAPMLTGSDTLRLGGGVVIARGEVATREEAALADTIARAMPRGPLVYLAFFAVAFVVAAIFTHHMRRSGKGRLIRVQVVSLAAVAIVGAGVKLLLLSTALSALVVPVAAFAIVATMALDRIVGIATGVLAALVVSLLAPFDVGVAILLLVQAATAGLVVPEHPRRRWLAAGIAGLATTLCTSTSYFLLAYLATGDAPLVGDPLHSPWLAAAIGPAIAALIAVPVLPAYQLAVGEITQARLFALEDLGHPLLRQIAERSPGTWQHSLMMANMAEIAANAIGANGRLVRVGAYFHDYGKSLQAKYFIENLEAGESSPHDQMPPEASCDAIFAHVTDGIAAARKAGLHERIVDFMHMHHGSGVLEYFWAKCREQGNPRELTIDQFRYPGHPPQSRETAILAICDAVEAASRTLKKPEPQAIDSLVQRIVYGKLHLGQLDESGLSMGDLRRISDSLRETIRHANHGRIEYPWQKSEHDASASPAAHTTTSPTPLDSLDAAARRPERPPAQRTPAGGDDAFAATADLRTGARSAGTAPPVSNGHAPGTSDQALSHAADPAAATGAAPHELQGPSGGTGRTSRVTAPRTSPDHRAGREHEARMLDTGRRVLVDTGPVAHDSGRMARATDRGPIPASRVPGPVSQPYDTIITSLDGDEPVPLAPRSGEIDLDAARTTEAMPAIDLDNAITNPPPLRRGPSGHPPVPSDPAQLAAALTGIVTRVGRVGHAPFAAPAMIGEGSSAQPVVSPSSASRTASPSSPAPRAPAPSPALPQAAVPPAPSSSPSIPTSSASSAGTASPSSPPPPPPASRTRTASPSSPPPIPAGPATPTRTASPSSPPPLASRTRTASPSSSPPLPVIPASPATPTRTASPSSPPPLASRTRTASPSSPPPLPASPARTASPSPASPASPRTPPHAPSTSEPRAAPSAPQATPPAMAARTTLPSPPPRHGLSTAQHLPDLDGVIVKPALGPLLLPSTSEASRGVGTATALPAGRGLAPAGSTLPPRSGRVADASGVIAAPSPVDLEGPTTRRTRDFDDAVTQPSTNLTPTGASPALAIAGAAPRTAIPVPADLEEASTHVARKPNTPPTGAPAASAGARPASPRATASGATPAVGAPRISADLDEAATQIAHKPTTPPGGASRPTTAARAATPAAGAPRTAVDLDEAATQIARQPTTPPGGAPRPAIVSAARTATPAAGVLQAPATSDEAATHPSASTAANLDDPTVRTAPTGEVRVIMPRSARKQPSDGAGRTTREHHGVEPPNTDASATDPAVPVMEISADRREVRRTEPRRRAPLVSRSEGEASPWTTGLAEKIDERMRGGGGAGASPRGIDEALESDEWSKETPVVAPGEAELRTLFGKPDPTRQQPIAEIEQLQRRAAELADEVPRRAPHPTAEVDPDDIEAAIEVAPPARRLSHTKPSGKPKKTE